MTSPNGKTTTYTYTTGFEDEQLNHDLLTVTDPKGQVYLENIYAHTIDVGDPRATEAPEDLYYDRIVRQIWGDPDDVIDFVYLPEDPEPSNNFAVIRVLVNDRVGNVKEIFFDDGNRNVIEREYTGRWDDNEPTFDVDLAVPDTTKLRLSDPDFFETRWEYNADSLPVRILYPNLNETTYLYDEANPNRRAQGNVLEMVRLPGPLGGDQVAIIETFAYDDGFGGCCGSNFVTLHVDGRGGETIHEYDAAGNRTHTTHPVPSVVEDFEYNEFGQLTAHMLPNNGSGHRRRDVYTYYDSGPQTGYRSSEIVDATGFGLTTTYEYDGLGRLTRQEDARGADELTEYNALDQVVRHLSREVVDGSGIRYERLTWYDANDNVVREDVENQDEDGTQLPNSHFSTIHEYEILNHLVRTCREVGDVVLANDVVECGDLPLEEFVVTELEYDANRNRLLERDGEAANGNQPDNAVAVLYDERDLVFQVIRGSGGADESTDQVDYDGNGNRVLTLDGLGDAPRVTTFAFDGYDRRVGMSGPMGNTIAESYDANGNLLTIRLDGELVDVAGSADNVRLYESTYSYDALNRLTQTDIAHFDSVTQTPVGDGLSTWRTEYSDNSQVIRSIDDNSNEYLFTFDTANRPLTRTDNLGNTWTLAYDGNSNVVTSTEIEKSDLGDPDEVYVRTYTYDGLDRLVANTDNVGNTESEKYDSRSNRTVAEDELGSETRYEYDGLNRLTRITRDLDGDGADGDAPDVVTVIEWDDSSRETARTDGEGNTTRYDYDGLNRMTRQVNADDTEETSTYDVHDNRLTVIDPNGSVCALGYDGLDRLTSNAITPGPGVSSDSTTESYTYDGRSRVVEARNDGSVVERTYDSRSNVLSESINGVSTSFTYDGVDNQLSCLYPDGRAVTRSYDALNRVATIEDQSGALAAYDYIGPSRVLRRTNGNGTRVDFTYDGLLPNPPGDFGERRVVETKHSVTDGGAVIDQRTYTWDAAGNKKSREDVRVDGPQRRHDYSYDAIYRLTRATELDGEGGTRRDTTYTYDRVGNRTEVLGNPNPGLYTLDASTPEPADAQVNQYTQTPFDARRYDANGNLTRTDRELSTDSDEDGDVDLFDYATQANCLGGTNEPPAACAVDADHDNDGDADLADYAVLADCLGGPEAPPDLGCSQPAGTVLTYDYRNRLVAFLDEATGEEHRYAYDALDRRIERRVDVAGADIGVRYFYDGFRVIAEQDDADIFDATYVGGHYMDAVITMRRHGVDHYYHTDDQFSVFAVTDENGAVAERYEYDDFGRITILGADLEPRNASEIENPYLFTGRRYDPETELYYYRARYLDSRTGRFTSADPVGIWQDELNLGSGRTYVGNNPLTYLDPFGEAGYDAGKVMDRVLLQMRGRGNPDVVRMCGRIYSYKLLDFTFQVGTMVITAPLEVAAGHGVFGKLARKAKGLYDKYNKTKDKADKLRDELKKAMKTGDIVTKKVVQYFTAPCMCTLRMILNTKNGKFSIKVYASSGTQGDKCCPPHAFHNFYITGQAKKSNLRGVSIDVSASMPTKDADTNPRRVPTR
jgi:RHS repeat-associated protein